MMTSAALAALPSAREVLPEWAEHVDKLNALRGQLERAETEAAALCRQLSAVGEWHVLNVSPPSPEPTAYVLSDRARSLLGPDFVPEPETAPPRPAAARPRSEMRRRYDNLCQEIDALREAITVLERPRAGDGNSHTRGAQLFYEANRRRFSVVEPDLRAAELQYLRALVELARAMAGYGHLLNELRGVEASVPFKASPLPAMLGEPRDPHSEIRRILRWGIECGRIGASDLPAEWREVFH